MSINNDVRPKRHAYILTIWEQGERSAWRGSLEQMSGNRDYFETVAQLAALLQTQGWCEANIPTMEPNDE